MKHYRQHEKTEYFIDDFAVPHLMAMTKEGLHRKAEIAEELGYRDMQIKVLREQLASADSKKEHFRNLLEDVVNELDLSDGVIEKHGPMGTEPSILVRLILDRKDLEISALEKGFKRVNFEE
jgi:hypothetical protein